MPEDYDELIHGAFGDFTEDAESTITSRGSGDVRDKVALDREYMNRLSIWVDVLTLGRTALKVLGLYRGYK